MSYGIHFAESWLHERIAKLEAERDALAKQLIDARMAANDNPAPEKDVSGADVDVTTEERSKTEHDGVTKTPDLLNDSQDKLYEDVNSLCVELWDSDALCEWNTANMLKRRIIALLDRQAAITKRET